MLVWPIIPVWLTNMTLHTTTTVPETWVVDQTLFPTQVRIAFLISHAENSFITICNNIHTHAHKNLIVVKIWHSIIIKKNNFLSKRVTQINSVKCIYSQKIPWS